MARYGLIVVVVALALAGCSPARDDAEWQSECVAEGLTPGTPEFADCLSARQEAFEDECLSAVAACQ